MFLAIANRVKVYKIEQNVFYCKTFSFVFFGKYKILFELFPNSAALGQVYSMLSKYESSN